MSIKLSLSCEYTYTIEEMELFFISIVEQQDHDFGCHLSNYFCNIRSIVRRRMGQIKRMLRMKHIPLTQHQHLDRMINIFKNGSSINDRVIKDNIVLNGYPL